MYIQVILNPNQEAKGLGNLCPNIDSFSNAVYRARITIAGPDGKWFGVGLGAKTFKMSDQPYTIVVDGSGKVSEYKLGDHSKGQILATSVVQKENEVVNGRRKILLVRYLKVFTRLNN